MNWDAIGAIGEILGAFAVFATLVYVALQIRHSIQATRGLVRESVSDRVVADIRAPLNNERLAVAFLKLEKDEPLTEMEVMLVDRHARAWLRTHENLYYQYRQGFLEKEEWQGHRRVLMTVFDPNFKHGESDFIVNIYDRWPDAYSTHFQDLIDRVRSQLAEREGA